MRMVGNGIIKTDAPFTQQGAISGDSLVKTGGNTLTMTGNLTTARTIVREGSMNYSGSGYNKVVELQGNASISGDGFIPSPLYVASGARATLTLTNTYYQAYKGSLTGSGQLTINPTNTVSRVAITGNWTNFTGTIVYNNTSILMPLKNSGMPNATFITGANTNIGIAASSDNASVTYPIGKLTGSGRLRHKEVNFGNSSGVSGNVTWKVGNTDLGNFTFNGSIYDAGGSNKSNFEKVGDCTMTVGGTWENSGTVKVSEGTLIVSTSKTLGTGALTVANGATLMGLSSTVRASSKTRGITNSSVTINGTLRTGTEGNSTSGYWYLGTHPLTFGSTGKLYVGVAKCSTSPSVPGCSHIWSDEAKGSITFKDGATVSVYLASSYDPVASIGTDEAKADSFMVFNFQKATVGDVKFELPELPDHYYWDTTSFTTGYLFIRYTPATGIDIVQRATSIGQPDAVYDLKGRLVRRVSSASDMKGLPAGVYIRGGKTMIVK